ncbi:hypothetical protein [Halopiger djelfimassiliensis]|uniref:hypothetical protein n=1 Tax=Halopiger djelfimassiliensis TaxID=1293047 RepID=UPI0012B572EA|nr:hypothetical protein [Halopiger djelfimassiliensis]
MVVVVGVAGAFLLWFGDLSSSSAAGGSIARFIYAFTVTLAPTSHAEALFAVFIAAISSVLTLRSGRVVAALLVGAIVYVGLSFTIAYFTAPV